MGVEITIEIFSDFNTIAYTFIRTRNVIQSNWNLISNDETENVA